MRLFCWFSNNMTKSTLTKRTDCPFVWTGQLVSPRCSTDSNFTLEYETCYAAVKEDDNSFSDRCLTCKRPNPFFTVSIASSVSFELVTWKVVPYKLKNGLFSHFGCLWFIFGFEMLVVWRWRRWWRVKRNIGERSSPIRSSGNSTSFFESLQAWIHQPQYYWCHYKTFFCK